MSSARIPTRKHVLLAIRGGAPRRGRGHLVGAVPRRFRHPSFLFAPQRAWGGTIPLVPRHKKYYEIAASAFPFGLLNLRLSF